MFSLVAEHLRSVAQIVTKILLSLKMQFLRHYFGYSLTCFVTLIGSFIPANYYLASCDCVAAHKAFSQTDSEKKGYCNNTGRTEKIRQS